MTAKWIFRSVKIEYKNHSINHCICQCLEGQKKLRQDAAPASSRVLRVGEEALIIRHRHLPSLLRSGTVRRTC
ncbi:MAG: hypothetical protein QG664_619 [Patescibacteria group bacterium]|nr:hypothetical protein [Patescibacteria group bacterium]